MSASGSPVQNTPPVVATDKSSFVERFTTSWLGRKITKIPFIGSAIAGILLIYLKKVNEPASPDKQGMTPAAQALHETSYTELFLGNALLPLGTDPRYFTGDLMAKMRLKESQRQAALEKAQSDTSSLNSLPDNLKNDVSFWSDVVAKNPLLLEHAPEGIKDKKEIVLQAVRKNPNAILHASTKLQEDESIWLEIVGGTPLSLEKAPDSIKNNINIVLKATTQNPVAIQFASKNLIDDSAVWNELKSTARITGRSANLETLKIQVWTGIVSQDGLSLKNAPDSIKGNANVVLEAVTKNPDAIKFASESLKNDPFWKKAVEQNPLCLKHAPETIKGDKEIVLTAGIKDRNSLKFASINVIRTDAFWKDFTSRRQQANIRNDNIADMRKKYCKECVENSLGALFKNTLPNELKALIDMISDPETSNSFAKNIVSLIKAAFTGPKNSIARLHTEFWRVLKDMKFTDATGTNISASTTKEKASTFFHTIGIEEAKVAALDEQLQTNDSDTIISDKIKTWLDTLKEKDLQKLVPFTQDFETHFMDYLPQGFYQLFFPGFDNTGSTPPITTTTVQKGDPFSITSQYTIGRTLAEVPYTLSDTMKLTVHTEVNKDGEITKCSMNATGVPNEFTEVRDIFTRCFNSTWEKEVATPS